jgi:hypothetical protein
MADEVKWWQYSRGALDLAAKMHEQGHLWGYIAKYLYTHFECAYLEPDWLGRAVIARQKGEGRPPQTRRGPPPPLPPPPKPPAIPKEEPGPPVDVRADWAKQFPDERFPGEPEATLALMRAEHRRRG